MSEAKKRSESILKALVLLLVVAVLAQTYFMYQLYSGKQAATGDYDNQLQASSVQCPVNVQPSLTPQRNAALPPAPSIGPKNRQSSANQQQLMSALQQMLGGANSNAQVVQPQQQAKPLPGAGNVKPQVPRPNMNINMFGPMGGGGDPFAEMERMHKMMSAMMSNRFGRGNRNGLSGGMFGGMRGASPTIQADKDNYIVKMQMTGLDKSNIKTQVNGRMLTISGVQKESTQGQQGNNMVAQSQSVSQFQNSMSLPGPVQSDKLKVDYNNNILTITIPKA